MAIPIAPTPFLTGKSAERFDRLLEQWAKEPKIKLEPPKVDMEEIKRIREKILREKGLIK